MDILQPKVNFLFYPDNLASKSFHTFSDMRLTGLLCDVTFKVENLTFRAHRLILAASIPYFRAMFLNDGDGDSSAEITLREIKSDVFESLMGVAYCCQLEINLDNAKSLLIGAALLQMEQVSSSCQKFLCETMHPGNVIELRQFACKHGFVILKAAADEYLQKNFSEIYQSKTFLNLHFSDLKELISKDELCVSSEELVFQAVMTWVKSSAAKREDKLPELLRIVRMPLLDLKYLSLKVATEDLIRKSVACRDILDEAKDYHIFPERRSVLCNFTTKRRLGSNDVSYLYAVCMEKKFRTVVQRFDFKLEKWNLLGSESKYAKGSTVAVMDKYIYVIGGCNTSGKALSVVKAFNTESGSWDKVPLMNFKKHRAAAASLGQKLYVCGGETDSSYSCSVECFCPKRKQWTTLPSMLYCRSEASAVAFDGEIYVLGGRNSRIEHRSVERYNAEVKQWIYVSKMNGKLCRQGATCLNGKIYAHGKRYVEAYDPQSNAWVKVCSARDTESSFTMCSFDGKLYAISTDGRLFNVYNAKTNKWSEARCLSGQVHVVGTAIV